MSRADLISRDCSDHTLNRVALICAHAAWADGLRADVPDDAAAIRELYGIPTAGTEWDLLYTSGCALVAGGILARSGVAVPWAGKPYAPSSAVSRLFEFARGSGCLHPPTGDGPLASDIVILTGPEHVLTVIDRVGDTVTSVDGGQAWPRIIHRVERSWQKAGLDYYVMRSGSSARRVLAVIDSAALPWSDTCLVPEGADI